MAFEQSVHAKAIDLIRLVIEMSTAAGSGHPTSAASLAHIVTVLMYHEMRFDPERPDEVTADRLVLSEGHACPIVYAAAADLGVVIGRHGARRRMTRDDAMTLREIGSPIDGHPNPAEGFPFLPAATGSLGQGLSIAAGLALAARLDGIQNRVFCLIGDGESREGQIAEALDFLIDYDLRSVCPIFNCNSHGQADRVSRQQSPETLAAKLDAYGFEARIIDGHSPIEIFETLQVHEAVWRASDHRPVAIVARTVKGWGFSDVLPSSAHGKAVSPSDLGRAMESLDRMASRLGARWTEGDLVPKGLPETHAPLPRRTMPPRTLGEAARHFGHEPWFSNATASPRKAYGLALRALGHANSRIVVLDGDVRNSTFSELFHDDGELAERFFECKIAEQNMVSCAAGLAAGGKIPFVSTFGKFLVRAYDQLEMAMISRADLKLVGSHVGASVAADGPSQMALADVAFFHALAMVRHEDGQPLMYVLNAADARAVYRLTLAMAEHAGACYLRTMRPEVPFLYDETAEFRLGGHHVLQEGEDLLLIASGYMAHEAKQAMEMLAQRGAHPTLVDLYSVPFDVDAILALAEKNDGRVLTIEDNYGAGFGAAVAGSLAGRGGDYHVSQLHVRKLPKSARRPEEELHYLGLGADDIAARALKMLGIPAESAAQVS